MKWREAAPRDMDESVDTLELTDERRYRAEPLPPKRPWLLIAASLLLVVLVAVLWAKWSESETKAEQLRAELKNVYVEAEGLRTQAAEAQQRVSLLDQQVRSLTAERTDILKRLQAAGGEMPKTKSSSKRPARAHAKPSRAKRSS